MDISQYDKYLIPPKYCKDAIITIRGWVHPKTKELLVCKRFSDDMVAYYNKVVSGEILSYTAQKEAEEKELQRLQRNHDRKHCKLIKVNGEIVDMMNPFNLKSKVVPLEVEGDESDEYEEIANQNE